VLEVSRVESLRRQLADSDRCSYAAFVERAKVSAVSRGVSFDGPETLMFPHRTMLVAESNAHLYYDGFIFNVIPMRPVAHDLLSEVISACRTDSQKIGLRNYLAMSGYEFGWMIVGREVVTSYFVATLSEVSRLMEGVVLSTEVISPPVLAPVLEGNSEWAEENENELPVPCSEFRVTEVESQLVYGGEAYIVNEALVTISEFPGSSPRAFVPVLPTNYGWSEPFFVRRGGLRPCFGTQKPFSAKQFSEPGIRALVVIRVAYHDGGWLMYPALFEFQTEHEISCYLASFPSIFVSHRAVKRDCLRSTTVVLRVEQDLAVGVKSIVYAPHCHFGLELTIVRSLISPPNVMTEAASDAIAPSFGYLSQKDLMSALSVDRASAVLRSDGWFDSLVWRPTIGDDAKTRVMAFVRREELTYREAALLVAAEKGKGVWRTSLRKGSSWYCPPLVEGSLDYRFDPHVSHRAWCVQSLIGCPASLDYQCIHGGCDELVDSLYKRLSRGNLMGYIVKGEVYDASSTCVAASTLADSDHDELACYGERWRREASQSLTYKIPGSFRWVRDGHYFVAESLSKKIGILNVPSIVYKTDCRLARARYKKE